MKLWRVLGIFGLVALLVPLSGCIGGDDPAPQPKVSGGSAIEEGIPPQKFTFEPVPFKPAGELERKKHTRTAGDVPLPPLQKEVVEWTLEWNVTGLVDLGQGEQGKDLGEAFYQVWLGKKDGEEIVWEQAANSQTPAPDGQLSGKTAKEKHYKDYVGIMVTLETKADADNEIPILRSTALEPEKEQKVPLEDLKVFGASFADAKVVTDGAKVNLSVNAFTLPGTTGSYDVFLRNQGGTTYLGSLKLDPSTGGYSIAITPDPKVFTKYQFFISIENSKEKKDENGGFTVLRSNFKG